MIEGLPSFILSVMVFLFLPSLPAKSRYLTEDERTLEIKRLNLDSLNESDTGIDWGGVKRALTDPKAWIVAVSNLPISRHLNYRNAFRFYTLA
jgi:hypothetical protein